MKKLFPFFLVLSMTSCTWFGNKDERRHITLKLSANRMLEMEPCGCVLKDLGGIDAELVLHQEWKGPRASLYLAGGTTFAPKPDSFVVEDLDHYRMKAEYVVKAMNRLGVSVITPTAADLALGTEFIQSLREKADFSFVSANLFSTETKKALFEPMVIKEVEGVRFAVFGISGGVSGELSGNAQPAYPKAPGVELRDPKPIIKELIESHKNEGVVFVALSSASRKAHDEWLREFPQLRLIVGGTPQETFPGVDQPVPQALLFNPEPEGRVLTFLEMKAPKTFTRYFGPEMVSYANNRIANLAFQLKTRNEALASPNTPAAERGRLLDEVSGIKKAMGDARALVQEPDAKTAIFGWQVSNVHRGPNPPKNELTKLIDEFNEAVRQKALGSAKASK